MTPENDWSPDAYCGTPSVATVYKTACFSEMVARPAAQPFRKNKPFCKPPALSQFLPSGALMSADNRERDGLNAEATASLRWIAGALLIGGALVALIAILAA
jgi:hypothetical protein